MEKRHLTSNQEGSLMVNMGGIVIDSGQDTAT